MNTSHDPLHLALSCSPSVGRDEDNHRGPSLPAAGSHSFSKRWRQWASSLREANQQVCRKYSGEQKVVSRYEVDIYGRPKVLSRWETVLYALAWPAVVGLTLGFGFAILLVIAQNDLALQALTALRVRRSSPGRRCRHELAEICRAE